MWNPTDHSKHAIPRVLLAVPTWLPSASIYIIKPLQQLSRRGLIQFEALLESDLTVPLVNASDLVLFCRNSDPVYGWILEECLARDIPTIYDLDDNFWEVPEEMYYARLHRSPERLRQLERYLASARLVRVYSAYLGRLIQRYNQHIQVVPPSIDLGLTPVEPLPRPDDKIRLTYVTGRGNEDRLISVFADDLLAILDEYPGQVEMTWWWQVPPQFRHHPGCRLTEIIYDYDLFLHRLARMHFDIGLAPLLPTPFYLSKTNTKFRDYGACRIAGIYSPVEVYTGSVEDGRTGLFAANEPGAWYRAIKRLVEDAELRQSITEAAYTYVYQNYRQELMETAWMELIDEMMATVESGRVMGGVSVSEAKKVAPETRAGKTAAPAGVQIQLEAAPERPQHGKMWINLPSGMAFSLPVDLGQALPLKAGCAALVVCEHVLDNLAQPEMLLREVNRISQPQAQLCLLEAYTSPVAAGEDAALVFNEWTLRRLADGEPPAYRAYPLLQEQERPAASDARVPGLDFHCLRMELFYAPEFLNRTEEQRMRLRQEQVGVCDAILYHFVVRKPAEGSAIRMEEDQSVTAADFVPYQPEKVQVRRARDTNQALKLYLDDLRYEARSWRGEMAAKDARLAQLEQDVQARTGELQAAQAKWNAAEADLQAQREELLAITEQLALAAQQRASYEATIQAGQQEIARLASELSGLREYLARQLALGKLVAGQLDAYRQRNVIRWLERLRGRSDDAPGLPAELQPLRDDSLIFNRMRSVHPSRLRLVASRNLQSVPYLPYPVTFGKAGLSSVACAPLLDLLPTAGELGVEILSPQKRVLRTASRPANQIEPGQPFAFSFEPLAETAAGEFEVRLFARNLDFPVRVYEWQGYSLAGLLAHPPLPFLAYTFTGSG